MSSFEANMDEKKLGIKLKDLLNLGTKYDLSL